MKILSYSTKTFELSYLQQANTFGFEINMSPQLLTAATVDMSRGYDGIMIFTGDDASASVIQVLKKNGVKFICTRAAGHDNVDIEAAAEAGIRVANVPAYSPYAIAEHAIALMLTLNRQIIAADKQVHRFNFEVDDLIGFDLHGKTVGVIGTGTIGSIAVKILHGFGCKLLAHDTTEQADLINDYKIEYTDLADLCERSDVISIHVPLNTETKYIINAELIAKMKTGVMLINTGRGAVVNTLDIINALHAGKIGSYGADVYEKEKGVFFFDRSSEVPADPMLHALLKMKNVLITPHQGFATAEAIKNISDTSLQNMHAFNTHTICANELTHIVELCA
jgi:D-lactate dehydrogenase